MTRLRRHSQEVAGADGSQGKAPIFLAAPARSVGPFPRSPGPRSTFLRSGTALMLLREPVLTCHGVGSLASCWTHSRSRRRSCLHPTESGAWAQSGIPSKSPGGAGHLRGCRRGPGPAAAEKLRGLCLEKAASRRQAQAHVKGFMLPLPGTNRDLVTGRAAADRSLPWAVLRSQVAGRPRDSGTPFRGSLCWRRTPPGASRDRNMGVSLN